MKDPNRHTPQWKFTLGKLSEAKFLFLPCNLLTHKTISRAHTGDCELWNRQIDLTIPPAVQEATHDSEQYDTPSQPPIAEDWLTKATLAKFQALPEMTFVYGIDGKCSNTITPQRLRIIWDAYNSARHRGVHALLNRPFQDLATKFLGLLHRLPQLSKTGNYTEAECSLSGSAHPFHDSLLQNHALVTKQRSLTYRLYPGVSKVMDSPPKRQSIWFQDRCVSHTVHRILHLPPDV